MAIHCVSSPDRAGLPTGGAAVTWAQMRECKACLALLPIYRFQVVRNRGQKPTRRRTCWDCRLPDLAAYNRKSRAKVAS